ncbi:NADH-quinone oxidoreductase subunit NuoE [Candidatus Neoehrlichia procyonis]|uniref:NADH-quinone oxidoreductase subunit E n=1 Tax=Candidatus Neoehrlichia procyonis str. RAC413 TaxID=1359163 RepID=A0A0F3NM23_9RICK|nr:NADH-quinone oxidoreductase subunit NuoE [Candidatus Neoehrlichia lotoris]KJV68831.1 NADH-quinone oxidoreductase, E subunit [Candidatus Neoehrlichia lotoris str. RAC413]
MNNAKIDQKDDEKFQFTSDNLQKAKKLIGNYPKGRESSAVMSLLYIAQKQCKGYISLSAMDYIAKMLNMRLMHVYEVAKFYSMYNLSPVGQYLIQVCRTTPCWLCGSNDILDTCRRILNIDFGETTKDNLFTLKETECLGACIDAPVVQINNDYYERLTVKAMEKIIYNLKNEN